jgi:hypothetical protein
MAIGNPAAALGPRRGSAITHRLALVRRDPLTGYVVVAVVAVLVGLLTAVVLPRGATTAGQGLVAMAIGFALGLVAGVVSPSRWAVLLALLVAASRSVGPSGTVGPSVTAVRLDTPFGILAILLTRGLHLVLFGLPLLVGDGVGRYLMRRTEGTAEDGSLGAGAVGVALTVGLAALVAWPPARRRCSRPTGPRRPAASRSSPPSGSAARTRR